MHRTPMEINPVLIWLLDPLLDRFPMHMYTEAWPWGKDLEDLEKMSFNKVSDQLKPAIQDHRMQLGYCQQRIKGCVLCYSNLQDTIEHFMVNLLQMISNPLPCTKKLSISQIGKKIKVHSVTTDSFKSHLSPSV